MKRIKKWFQLAPSGLRWNLLYEEFAEKNGLVPYIHITDDGFSGTNWQRPGWQELIAKVEADEVLCICIKDGTRLGRDYLRAGLYREMFKERGVRLVAVNDGYDTNNGDDDFTPFREIIAEMYARDTSKKIKSVIQAKGKSGKPLSTHAPYGFIKDSNDKNKWLVDEPAAAIVRRIFQMTIDGVGPYEIARRLHDDKVERPSYYLGSRGRGNHSSNYKKDEPYSWYCSAVTNILARVEYAGHTSNFKTRRENFKSKKATIVPKEERLLFENTHEAIVSQEVFDTVQKLRKTTRRINYLGESNPLTGIAFCSDCGAKLYNHRKSRPAVHKKHQKNGKEYVEKKPQDIYQCSQWKLNDTKFNKVCSQHYIRTEVVKEIILDILKKTSCYVQEHEVEFVEQLRESSVVKQGSTAKANKKQIAKNERRISELNKIILALYEDKALGKLPEERYEEMTANYDTELAEIKSQNAILQSELDEFTADNDNIDKFIALVRKYTRFETLTNSMINEFVDKIIVHEAVWSEEGHRGSRSQQVDVYLKYIGKFDTPDMRTAEEIEAERIVAEKEELNRKRSRENQRRYDVKRKEAQSVAV